MNNKQSAKEILKTLKIIHFALITGVLMFLAVIFFALAKNPSFFIPKDAMFYLYISILLPIPSLFIGKYYYNSNLEKCRNKETLEEKIQALVPLSIVKFALIEGPAMFACVAFLLTNSLYFVIIVAFLIFIFISVRPTKETVKRDLLLSDEELAEL